MAKRVQKILNPDTKGLPRKDFEHLYPEQKFVRGQGRKGPTGPAGPIKSKGRKMKMQQRMKPYKRDEGGFLGKVKSFGKKLLESGEKPKGQIGRGGANTVTGKIERRLSVKEKAAAKRKAGFDKATKPAGMSTTGNPYGSTTKSTSKKGDTFGAKPKVQFPKTTGSYKIKKGDTLSSIAKARGTTVAKIMEANPGIKDKNKIRLGAGLKGVPGAQGSSTIKNIADAGKKRKADPKGTTYGELYKGKGKKKKTTSKAERGKRDFSRLNFFKTTEKQKQRRAALKAKFGKSEGGMASMDDYMKDLL